ncbi:DUF2652 domain-containing protein [Psychroserpens algicola]|uniref:DUF2652 domain-containing protein n=1 Tax=Psychroserpens algicola TaxID=1719034 RepID=A0ABT0H4U0_9FLAO|nr:DUF2652 domain-containing protein [Psychroserpens algicola]MCK8479385.1 DUF2652 domain-containing protein [Psychroserpens algicola]
MASNPTLICIPDISGFTRFMSDTNIELSAKVIPALLNKIIYANEIGLRVSEIEGDAILFFKKGPLPPFQDLINQCKSFFTQFYQQLEVLSQQYSDERGIDQVPKLGLKIILHFGKNVESVQIGNRIKLMGEDVIIAHRLLKNDIKEDEYLLISEQVLNQYKDEVIKRNFGWGDLQDEGERYKHLGDINYSYVKMRKLLE